MKAQSSPKKQDQNNADTKPTREDAEKAVETLIRWAGEDPARKEIQKTPSRFINAFEEHFSGYSQNPDEVFGRDFEDAQDYNDYVLLTDIPVHSHCQHHMHPILGRAHIAYWPDGTLAGLSKFARVVNILSKRMVSQEILTRDIRACIDRVLKPKGSAVIMSAKHLCMSTRGVNSSDIETTSSSFSGIFDTDRDVRTRLLNQIHAEKKRAVF